MNRGKCSHEEYNLEHGVYFNKLKKNIDWMGLN